MLRYTKLSFLPEYAPVRKVLIYTPSQDSLSILRSNNYKEYLFRDSINNVKEFVKDHEYLEKILKNNKIDVTNIRNLEFPKNIGSLIRQNPNSIFTRD